MSDLTFELEAGTVTGFLGPNGAGKTTTLRMVLGLAAPTTGRALVFDRPFAELERPATRVGAVLEAADLHPGRTGRDHLRVLACAARVRSNRVDEVLQLVDMREAAERRAGGYSLGMRQRLGLAGALLGDPELLILDEPANGLDPAGVRWLRDFLRSLASEGRTVLISSHHLAEVQETVDQVVIINRGRLVVQSSLDQLTARLAGTVRVVAARPEALERALHDAGVTATERANGTLRVHGASSQRIGEIALAADVAVGQLVAESSSLEDVFLELIAQPPSDAPAALGVAEDAHDPHGGSPDRRRRGPDAARCLRRRAIQEHADAYAGNRTALCVQRGGIGGRVAIDRSWA